jgi:hypothetical protein
MTNLYKRLLYVNDSAAASHLTYWDGLFLESLALRYPHLHELQYADPYTIITGMCCSLRDDKTARFVLSDDTWCFTKLGGVLSLVYALSVTPKQARARMSGYLNHVRFVVGDKLVYCEKSVDRTETFTPTEALKHAFAIRRYDA